jgi:hypothetical protein
MVVLFYHVSRMKRQRTLELDFAPEICQRLRFYSVYIFQVRGGK